MDVCPIYIIIIIITTISPSPSCKVLSHLKSKVHRVSLKLLLLYRPNPKPFSLFCFFD